MPVVKAGCEISEDACGRALLGTWHAVGTQWPQVTIPHWPYWAAGLIYRHPRAQERMRWWGNEYHCLTVKAKTQRKPGFSSRITVPLMSDRESQRPRWLEETWLDSRRGVSLKLTSLLEPLKSLTLGWGRSCVPCVPLLAVIKPHAELSQFAWRVLLIRC